MYKPSKNPWDFIYQKKYIYKPLMPIINVRSRVLFLVLCFSYLGLHPRKLTWIPKMAIFERRYILKTIILGSYVRSRGYMFWAYMSWSYSYIFPTIASWDSQGCSQRIASNLDFFAYLRIYRRHLEYLDKKLISQLSFHLGFIFIKSMYIIII